MWSPQLGSASGLCLREDVAYRVNGSNLQRASSECLSQVHFQGRNKAHYYLD